MKPASRCALGIDIGGAATKIAVVSPAAKVLHFESTRTELDAGVAGLLDRYPTIARCTIRHGLPGGAPSGPDFSNYLFNKVFVGNRWVRLNYNVLGQNTLDDSYFGPLTHILTTTSLSEVPIAETWGTRYATYPKAGPALSSINPYRLLKVSGHFGSQSRIANPAVADEELRKVTVVETYWKDALPAAISTLLKDPPAPISTSASRSKRRLPVADAGVCTAGGPPVRVVRAGPSGCEGHAHRHEFAAGVRGRPYQLFGARVDAESRADGGGAVYDPAGKHPFRLYAWSVQEGVVLKEWSWRGSKWGAE